MTTSAALGAGAGIGADHYLDLTGRTQLIVSLVVFVLVPILWNLLGIGYGMTYLYWVYDPYTGEIVEGYVGQTRQRNGERHRQHMGVSTRYRGPAASWSDTVVDPSGPEVLTGGRWVATIVLNWRERRGIQKYLPLYNDKMNHDNPRRIPRETARVHREYRDAQRALGRV